MTKTLLPTLHPSTNRGVTSPKQQIEHFNAFEILTPKFLKRSFLKTLIKTKNFKFDWLGYNLTNQQNLELLFASKLIYKTEQQQKQTYTHTICWDWVEFTALFKTAAIMPNSTFLFNHKESKSRSPYYKTVYDITTIIEGKELDFGKLMVCPRVDFIDPNICQFKLDNRFCYSNNIISTLQQFLTEYELTFKNYTRLDCAIDFQETNDYSTPQIIMDAFKTNEIIIKNKGNIAYYENFKVLNTIRFGSSASDTSTTFYNKTYEMKVKTEKPHIIKMWLDAGFDPEKDVYRLEFRNKKTTKDIVTHQGEFMGNFEDLLFLDNLEAYTKFNYTNHFDTYYATNKRISRCEKLNMLDLTKSPYKAQQLSLKDQSNNYKKSYIKKLAVDALFYQKKRDHIQATMCYNHLKDCVINANLQNWFHKKVNNWLMLEIQKATIYDLIHTSKLNEINIIQSQLNLN